MTTLWATQRKRRRGANKRGIISIVVIISNTIFKLACNIQNKTENPSKDALQKAESFKKMQNDQTDLGDQTDQIDQIDQTDQTNIPTR